MRESHYNEKSVLYNGSNSKRSNNSNTGGNEGIRRLSQPNHSLKK